MSSNGNRTYHGHRHHAVKTAVVIILVVLLLLAAIAISIFFGFKKYIVYTSDGIRLDVPWLNEEQESGEVYIQE